MLMMHLFHGKARKIAIPLLILSAIGWLTFVIGFVIGLRTKQRAKDTGLQPCDPQHYPFWAATGVGLFLYIGAFIHSAIKLQPCGAILQALIAFVSVIYLTAVGAVLFMDISFVYDAVKNNIGGDSKMKDHVYFPIEIVGCLFSAVFWGVLSATWPFYTDGKESEFEVTSANSNYLLYGDTAQF